MQNHGSTDRINEFIEVTLSVHSEQVTDPEKDVRVVIKPDWNIWSQITPCQVSRVQKTARSVCFRVAFFGDIPAHSTARFGILYGNPKAIPQTEKLFIRVSDKPEKVTVDTPTYIIGVDKKSGQIQDILYKYCIVGCLKLYNLNPTNLLQPGASVQFAVAGKDPVKGVWSRASETAPSFVSEEQGPIYYRHTTVRKLAVPENMNLTEGPELRTEMLFLASQPFIHIRESIKFNVDTPVFGLRLANFRFHQSVYSHFSFRPVTPDFKPTEIEEIGHILLAPEFTRDLPQGSVMSSFLPLEMAWTALLNIKRNEWYAQTRYLLDWG